jgi:hypothetical protein
MDFTILIIIVVLAFAFDLINGFHDAANSIATVVSTKVLTPFQAVLWAASFNWLAYLVFELNVVDTIAKIVDTSAITLMVILAGILAAIIWNLTDLVPGHPFQLISYPCGRFCRCCHCLYRLGCGAYGKDLPLLQPSFSLLPCSACSCHTCFQFSAVDKPEGRILSGWRSDSRASSCSHQHSSASVTGEMMLRR